MIRIRLLVAALAFAGIAQAAEPVTSFELALVDMQGQKKVLGTLPGSVFAPRISPDGTKVAFELADPPAPNTPPVTRPYVAELEKLDQRRALQATLFAPQNYAPIWSPDGDWIVFLASGNGTDSLFMQRADGSIQPKYLIDARAAEGFYKGGLLAFITLTGNRDYGISLLDMTTRKVTRLVDYPGTEQHSSRISPDGKWIVYASNETGRQEVWLESLPQNGKRFQLTRDGGRHPLWSPDGTSLYYDQGDKLFRLDMTLGETPVASAPVRLPISGFQQGDLRRQYDLMPDGKAFVMLYPARAAP
jgi:eukaryotic-like serine/threonine-protein kinase